jgi:hypothetical protein
MPTYNIYVTGGHCTQAQALLKDTSTRASGNGKGVTAGATGSHYAVTSADSPYTVLHATATLAQLLGVSSEELHSKGLLHVLQCTQEDAVEGAQELQLALERVRTSNNYAVT